MGKGMLADVSEDIPLAKKGEAPAGRRKVEKADKTLLIGIDLALWKALKSRAIEDDKTLKDTVIAALVRYTE
jgi:hypothetical protein